MSGEVYVKKAAPGSADAIAAAIEALMAELPAAKRLVPGCRVLLKPNLLSGCAPHKAVTTHPHVLRGVIAAVQRRGVTDILVADSPGGPYTAMGMRAVYKTCGLAAVCEEMGAAAYTDCKSTHIPAPGGVRVKEFEVLQPVAERDFIINLPKMKTHVLTGMSGAVKNLFGCVPGLRKPEFHMRFPERDYFGDMLVDLCEAIRADIHIVDGVWAMEGDGPGGGAPRACGLLFAGQNPYSVDLALCRSMGMAPQSIPMLAAAMRRGLCAEALDEALLIGDDDAKSPIEGFVHPRSFAGKMTASTRIPKIFAPLWERLSSWAAPKPKIKKRLCVGCGKCAQLCPRHIITLQNKKAHIHYKNCIRCFCCHEICPAKAVDIKTNRLFRL